MIRNVAKKAIFKGKESVAKRGREGYLAKCCNVAGLQCVASCWANWWNILQNIFLEIGAKYFRLVLQNCHSSVLQMVTDHKKTVAASTWGWRKGTGEVRLGVADTFWLFIFTLNQAKNYSIQNWIENIHSINHSFKLENKFQLEKTVKNRQKEPVLSSKSTFYTFFLWMTHFFNSFNRTAIIFIQQIY